ncbi:PREDICTED: kinesin-like protein KIF16B [Acropora digitifera]|uniref:kinesin-like protein KIF16B n=1 Tax=Acropora digitifera TaxID=70779 RepID=UPI00077A7F3D|nr:PREDICTED: kinesin-like protein KIF16B [Acropora digitifera]
MASLKVAVRARPLNNRELELGAKCIIQMEDQKTTIFNTKLYGDGVMEGDKARDSKKEFFFDHSYWSVDPKDQHFITQEQVFSDLGQGVLDAAFEGYNACLFAYGQTSAGKTYTMMGTNEQVGLIPRICKVIDVLTKIDKSCLFTALYTMFHPPEKAKFIEDMPSETISKIHLVDLAGSERATSSGAVGQRLKEGANINKSLVTLGIVISTLAENSINASTSAKRSSFRKKLFVPYRDSVLTFLLKDSLGGNSKTVMVAAISPAECNYGETLSTLRYAHRAKSIINSPTVNEDPNVKLIRELRSEIDRLKSIIRKTESGDEASLTDSAKAAKKLHENQARVEQLTKDWTEKWKEAQSIMQESELQLRRHGSCAVLVDLELPHLVRLEEDPLRTEIMLYRIMPGKTRIGLEDAPVQQDIVLEGDEVEKEHCVLDFAKGKGVKLQPISGLCWVNGVAITQSTILNQGDVIVLGKNDVFKFNYPTEAAKMREKRRSGLLVTESTESLSNFHISPVRGSHGDLSMRSDVSSPVTLDSGVEVDIPVGNEALEEGYQNIVAAKPLLASFVEQVKLLEIRENLNVVKAKAEESWNRDKLTLERTIEKDLIELNEVERKIHILEEKREQFSTDRSTAEHSEGARNEELEHPEEAIEGFDKIVEKRRVSDLGPKYSKAVALDLRQTKRRSLNFKSEITPSDSGRFDDILEGQLQNLHAVKVEKEKEIERNRITLGEEMTSVEYYGQQALENEAKMTELEEKYNIVRQQHEEKIRACLANLKNKEEDDVEAVDQEKERYRELIWKEYREIESLLVETFETDVLLESDEVTDSSVIAEKRLEVLDIVDERLRRIGSENDDLFLEFVAHKARFEKEEDRVHEQQKRISEQMLDGVKEKEIALQRLSGQREKFHVERVRERRLINARIHRLSRVRSSSDLQNEETLEFFKEEARKLREAFEKVDESESRLQCERRERENIHLQLEEARAKLRISEEDRSDCLNKLEDLEKQKTEKEKEIIEMQKKMDTSTEM